MVRIVMSALRPEAAEGRPVINTGISMMGLKGNDYVCGHCGKVMMQSFDASNVRSDMVYVCGACQGPNGLPHN
jgi:predicted SprT family Zn-dependent metalloprotease